MGLLSRSSDHFDHLHRDGNLCQLQNHFPAMDISHSVCTVSVLLSTGLCSRLCSRLVIDYAWRLKWMPYFSVCFQSYYTES